MENHRDRNQGQNGLEFDAGNSGEYSPEWSLHLYPALLDTFLVSDFVLSSTISLFETYRLDNESLSHCSR